MRGSKRGGGGGVNVEEAQTEHLHFFFFFSHKPTTVFYWVLQKYKCTTNHSAIAGVAGSQ